MSVSKMIGTGGTSPFGTKKTLPVCMERGILALEKIYINGGKRGYLVGMAPADAVQLLQATPVSVASPGPDEAK